MFTLNDLRKKFGSNPNVQFKEEIVGGKKMTTVSYMLADNDLFAETWGTELRGVCFDESGEIASLPFHKFFNLGENKYTQPEIVEDLMISPKAYAMEKVDGSMITPVVIDNDKVYLKTKKSFYSDVANLANHQMTDEVRELCIHLDFYGMTPIFEFTCMDNRVVIDYGSQPKFTLLAVRNKITGDYYPLEYLLELSEHFNVETAKVYAYSDTLNYKDQEGIEGYVLISGNNRVKVKTEWYLRRHRVLELRERDVVRMYLDEVLDDMIPELIASDVKMDEVYRIQDTVLDQISYITERVNFIAEEVFCEVGKNGKDIARWFSENKTYEKYSAPVFKLARGEFDVMAWAKEHYRKNDLKDWSLRSITNSNFGG